MTRFASLAFSLLLAQLWAQTTVAPGLRGVVTDPSGAAVPGAVIQLRGPGKERRAKTDNTGQYSFPSLAPGSYQVRVIAKGFSVTEKNGLRVDRPAVFDAQLVIRPETLVVNVEDELAGIHADPASNGSAVVLRQRQLKALSDDPDELAQQLQALAGPAPGPNGGQIYIDGFLGGMMPPKSSIREVRINSNPFSPEYDRPGFGRIEIFTRPGSDSVRGQAFAQYTDRYLISRNPLVAQSARPPYQTQFYGFNISGPLRKNKASFTLDGEYRHIDENAFILATTLDSALNPVKINQVVVTPQSRTSITPRLDYTIDRKNTLAIRYQDVRIGLDQQGIGDFSLATRAYNANQAEHTAQVTETAMISPRAINETRFQFLRASSQERGDGATPGINVQGAFYGGGPTIGNSATTTNSWELTNTSTYTRGAHTYKWGGRVRESLLSDTSLNNFAGTFTFFTLARYEQTLALQQAGYTSSQIVQLGAGPSQFSLNAGTPAARVSQTDIGLFVNDDWRARPNLTLSFGLRYEAQTNIGDRGDWSPRLAIAWGLDAKANRPAKTILRAGFGTFYDRIGNNVTLNARRYDGATQQSFLILNPTFFPQIPPLATLQAGRQPQQLQPVASGIQAPHLYQTSLGMERQVNRYSRLTATWTSSRGVHLLDARNINAPVGALYPYGDRSIRLLTESVAFSRLNQLIVSPSVNYKGLVLFGFYSLSYGRDNNEGMPADPYNLRAEWGPSSYGDVRHRLVLATALPLAWKFSVSPFLAASSGQPYNITTGLDPYDTGFPAERPALAAGVAASACQSSGLVYASGFGCFHLNPAPGQGIERNFGRGPATANLGLRLARTWAFGGRGETGPADSSGHPPGMGGVKDSGPPRGIPAGGPPAGLFGPNTGRKYNLMLTISTLNALNHPNFAPPNGDLSSPYFGQYRSLADLMGHMSAPTTYNRKIGVQLRFTF